MPLPESKRLVKIQDTLYNLKTYAELFKKNDEVYNSLTEQPEVVRFEDKTPEEIQ